ncbi:MAG TPA: RNA-binding protein [Verrucomicrobiae bacterium]
MISNERPSPYGYRPSHGHHSHSHHHHSHSGPKPPSNEETLRTEKIQIERKTFIMTLKENPRGRFLRITEDVGGRRDTIIIPATGLEDFKKVVEEMVNTSAETPLKTEAPEEGVD